MRRTVAEWKLPVRSCCIAAGAVLLSVFSGCGSDPGEGGQERSRVSASGEVTFDGQPIPAGSVTFLHADSGTYATCPIDDGEYENVRGDGPVVGKNVVSVIGLDGTNGTPLWGSAWSQEVDVTGTSFTQKFEIKKADTKPYVAPKPVNDPGSAGDEDKPLYE